jgi:ribonucrease Y
MEYLSIILIVVALIIGLVVGFVLANSSVNKSTKKQAETMIKEAELKNEAIKQEKIMQAKEKFLQLKSDHDKNVQERNAALAVNENKLKQARNLTRKTKT